MYYNKNGEIMKNYLKMFVLMLLMFCVSVNANAGIWTVSYSGGNGYLDYYLDQNHITTTVPYTINEGGWGHGFSTPTGWPDTWYPSSILWSGQVTATLTWHRQSPWESVPTTMTLREELYMGCSSGTVSYYVDFTNPDIFYDYSTSTTVDVYVQTDTVMNVVNGQVQISRTNGMGVYSSDHGSIGNFIYRASGF
jgi:hypothetical protein